MAEYCDGESILFATDPKLPVVVAHLAAGHRAVLLDGRDLVVATGQQRDRVLSLEHAESGRWRGDIAIESLLAAVGAACAMQLRIDLISTAINTFVPGQDGANEST